MIFYLWNCFITLEGKGSLGISQATFWRDLQSHYFSMTEKVLVRKDKDKKIVQFALQMSCSGLRNTWQPSILFLKKDGPIFKGHLLSILWITRSLWLSLGSYLTVIADPIISKFTVLFNLLPQPHFIFPSFCYLWQDV